MGSYGRRKWPASPTPGQLVLGLGLCLDYESLSKERNWSLPRISGMNHLISSQEMYDIFFFFLFFVFYGYSCMISHIRSSGEGARSHSINMSSHQWKTFECLIAPSPKTYVVKHTKIRFKQYSVKRFKCLCPLLKCPHSSQHFYFFL